MVLPVWNFQLLQESDLHVHIAELPSFLAQFGKRLKQFLLIASLRGQLGEYGLNPAAVGPESMNVLRSECLRKPANVPVDSIKHQPALVLRRAQLNAVV